MSGSPVAARSALKRRVTLRPSSGVPLGVVKTRPVSIHIAPAFAASNAWRSRWARSPAATDGGMVRVRRLWSVFGSTSWSLPSTRWRATRTDSVPVAWPASSTAGARDRAPPQYRPWRSRREGEAALILLRLPMVVV